MNDSILITIDIDWAPDEFIETAHALLKKSNAKATWFATHRSPVLDEIEKNKSQFEIGLHPNFFAGSTHGKSEEEVMLHMRNLFPNAVSMRTHGLYQSNRLLSMCSSRFGIENDSSQFLPGATHLQPHQLNIGERRSIKRFPYFWGDYYSACSSGFTNPAERINSPGLKIFNFHPVHLALNTDSVDRYEAYKHSNVSDSSGNLNLNSFINKNGRGAFTFFSELIDIAGHQTKTLKEFSNTFSF